jgi:hypothetical protein
LDEAMQVEPIVLAMETVLDRLLAGVLARTVLGGSSD